MSYDSAAGKVYSVKANGTHVDYYTYSGGTWTGPTVCINEAGGNFSMLRVGRETYNGKFGLSYASGATMKYELCP